MAAEAATTLTKPNKNMKTNRSLTILAISLCSLCGALTAQAQAEAEQGHDHAEHSEKKAGPNGGRLISTVEPHAEFFLTADRFVQITFINEEGKAIAPEKQVVSLVGGDRSDPIKRSFAPVDGVLRSAEPLPEQANMPIVLSIKTAPDAKIVREKFYLNESECGGCDFQEYACICGH